MANVDVASTATEIVAQNKRRIALTIKNNGSNTVYIEKTNAVTTSNGLPLAPGEELKFSMDGENFQFFPRNSFWGVVASGTEDVRVLEIEDI